MSVRDRAAKRQAEEKREAEAKRRRLAGGQGGGGDTRSEEEEETDEGAGGGVLREDVACPKCNGRAQVEVDEENECLRIVCLVGDPDNRHASILGKSWASHLQDVKAYRPKNAPPPHKDKPDLITKCGTCGGEAIVTDPGKNKALEAVCEQGHEAKLGRSWLARLQDQPA